MSQRMHFGDFAGQQQHLGLMGRDQQEMGEQETKGFLVCSLPVLVLHPPQPQVLPTASSMGYPSPSPALFGLQKFHFLSSPLQTWVVGALPT